MLKPSPAGCATDESKGVLQAEGKLTGGNSDLPQGVNVTGSQYVGKHRKKADCLKLGYNIPKGDMKTRK